MKLIITTILTLTSFSVEHLTKKEVLLDITRKYLPDNYIVLKSYHEETINMLAKGDSLEDYFFSYPTIIHEGFHKYEHIINAYTDSIRYYRLDDTLTIPIKKFNSFPSRQLNEFVSPRLRAKIFRYDTYINSEDIYDGTQQHGFLGLLEEYAAYYQGLKAYTSSFYFLRDSFGWSNPVIWIKYLSEAGSDIYSINEFKLFFSWYLQYAKLKRPDILKKISSDKNIKVLFSQIERNSQRLINAFLKNRIQILERIKPFTRIDNGFIYLIGSNIGYGIDDHIKILKFTESLLREPEHKVLKLLRQ